MYSFQRTITKHDIEAFYQLSGDDNPIHRSDTDAKLHGFPRSIGYGMLAAVFFSTLIGKYIPGHGAVYLSQSLTFHSPFSVGQKVTISGKVMHVNKTIGIMTLKTCIINQKKQILVSGEAQVKIPAQKV